MISLHPHTSTPIPPSYASYECQNWSPFSPALSCIFFSQLVCVLFSYLHVNVSYISLFPSFCPSIPPTLLFHYYKSAAFFSSTSLRTCAFLRQCFFSSFMFALFQFFFLSFLLFLIASVCKSFVVLGLILVSDPLPPPVAVPGGHSLYNYSF